jgi:hypothetical protein
VELVHPVNLALLWQLAALVVLVGQLLVSALLVALDD